MNNENKIAIPLELRVSPIGHGKKYKTILVDPPWKYGVWGSGSKNALVQGDANKPQPLPYSYMNINEIKALPLEILQLQNLKWLNVSNNEIKELPSEILQLQNLKWLNVENNKIKELPLEIWQLQNLIWLNV